MKKTLVTVFAALAVLALVGCASTKLAASEDAPKDNAQGGDMPAIPGMGGGAPKMNTKAYSTNAKSVYENVQYASVSKSEVCDMYIPEGKGSFPVLMLVHGGGFAFETQKMALMESVAQKAIDNGYAVVVCDYRKSSEAQFPGGLADVKTAVRFVRANADKYGFDANKIAIWGESAGAYLSLMTTLTPTVDSLNGDVKDNAEFSSSVNALVDFYGPAMVFNNVKGFPDSKVAIGLLASRKRVGMLLNTDYKTLGWKLRDAVKNTIKPVEIKGTAPCQEVVHKVTDPDFDLRKLVSAPTNTPEDAGPYVTMGLCMATDPEGSSISDVTIHRLCIQSKDEMTMWITPGSRHIGAMWDKALKMNKPLPISVSIGLDPAIYMSAGFEPPTTPYGFNELDIAGALRNKPVELSKCVAINEHCIARAEYVIEGELTPGITMREDINSNTGKAMPEFPGYTGDAKGDNLPNYLPVIKVKAVTTRKNPIMESCIGPSHEHVSMAGIPTEASVIDLVERAMPGRLVNVHAAPCGGGKFVTIIQFKKRNINDEGRQRQAELLAFSAFSEMKHVFLVDEDVDIFDMSDVMWAMTTRFQGDVDFIPIPGVHTHVLDPSNDPSFDPSIRVHGIACKAIFDCTLPYDLKDKFQRCQFLEVDPKKWLPDWR